MGLAVECAIPEWPRSDRFVAIPVGHSHPDANRSEFVVDGRIEWRERGKPPVEYGAGTLTWARAGTIYGYTVLEDAKTLILDPARKSGLTRGS